MTEFSWHTSKTPPGMRVSQVYGFLFDLQGRVLLRVDGTKHSLPGGRPEPQEQSLETTLRRECIEEVNVSIDDPLYLGYQRVDDLDGTPPYAQVRMVARIKAIGPLRPDPDTGRTYRRLLTSAANAGGLLSWGDLGHEQARAASRLAATALDLATGDPAPDAFA
jgi:8-oxo-dGTP pyrophosphatase MutT (NUDIX family)